MGEEASQIFQDIKLKKMGSYEAWCNNLVINVEGADSTSIESSIDESSEDSISSITSSSDLVEDASSSSSSPSSSSATSSPNGPLYELSDLMTQLPIKRGLSRHYQGKSQSFTSLASVRSLEDLPKKVIPCNRGKMKSCKSYGWGLDAAHNKSFSPKPTISKKGSNSRSCFMSSIGKRSLSTLVISE